MRRLSSFLIWTVIALLIVAWLPFVALTALFDRDPSRYRTGLQFRRLGKMISRVNPNWNVELKGYEKVDPRKPYVMVSNHLSNADIPVISNLPWEMKWVAKKELFSIPFVGWMMKLAGDIPVDRKGSRGQLVMFKRAINYLRNHVSVIFFPEGTRSRDGRMRAFNRGAFELAIREQISVLPIVLDGTQGCLPKNSWKFEPDVYVRLNVLDPVPTKGLRREQTDELMKTVRDKMILTLAELRNVPPDTVDTSIRKPKES